MPNPGELVPAEPAKQSLIIVGIGASAGGLEALKELVSGLPTEQPLSYIVAQHLSPTHTSMLRELLRPETELTMTDLTDRTYPQADTIYITPPNQDVEFVAGVLRLTKPKAAVGPKPSVDHFFKSLAEHHGENTVGIVLSGTGSDAAAGVRAIKAAGGVVLIQDPQTAKYDGMPRAAIQTGCSDLVMPAAKMGDVLAGLATAPINMRVPEQDEDVGGSYGRISTSVKRHTGFDLTNYKFATINRRLIRRMTLHKCRDFDEYGELVKTDREEAHNLVKDLLISVTSFFRDGESFDLLRPYLERLVKSTGHNDVLRVWVPGCATGEEAYTLAIILSEICSAAESHPDFLIFATDLDTDAVSYARNGAYPDAGVEKLPAELRDRYFDRSGKVYQVKKSLRQNMVFAVQNVIEDPPFSRMDLISCRNLLIYFTRATQRRVLEIFHYSLKAGGLLYLGKSESIELHKELFGDADKRAKLFRRKDGGSTKYAIPLGSRRGEQAAPERDQGGRRQNDSMTASYRLISALADAYCPPAVVINEHDECVHFLGNLKPFLRFPRGPAELRIYDLINDQWRGETRALIHRCRRENRRQTGNVFELEVDGEVQHFLPAVFPLPGDSDQMVAVGFEPAVQPLARVSQVADPNARDSLIIDELERELANTRQHLQTVVEELETSNEELLSQSEELQSANEELQSTNEELQTSNEELQSTNEELLTVNDELQNKSQELSHTASNLQSVKESLDFPLIVVDERLNITHFNHAANTTLPKEELQPNMSLASIDWHIDLVGLLPKIREVLRLRQPIECNLSDGKGRSFATRIMPAVSSDNDDASGAVLMFSDVSSRYAAETALREREALYRLSFELSPMGMAVLKPSLQMARVNDALCRMTGLNEIDLLSRTLPGLLSDSSAGELQRSLNELIQGNSKTLSGEFELVAREGRPFWVIINAVIINTEDEGSTRQLAVQVQDISQKRNQHSTLQREHQKLKLHAELLQLNAVGNNPEQIMGLAAEAIYRYHPECRVSLAVPTDKDTVRVTVSRQPPGTPAITSRELNEDNARKLARSIRAARVGDASSCLLDLDQASVRQMLGRFALPQRHDLALLDGGELLALISIEHAGDEPFSEDEVANFGALGDMLAHKLAESAKVLHNALSSGEVTEQKARLEIALGSIADGIITTDVSGNVDYLNPAAVHLTGYSVKLACGKPLDKVFRLISATDDREVINPAVRSLSDGRVIDRLEQDCFLVHRDGRKSVVQCSSAPFSDADGTITGAILVFRDVTDQNLLAAELSFRASHDPLTGLINRDEFDRRLKSALVEAKRNDIEHVLCYLDVDQFKVVNDTCGHGAGDEMLRQISEVLRAKLRQSDTLARLGGDEFGVLMTNCTLKRGREVVDELLEAVREFKFQWQESKFRVTTSCGVVAIDRDSDKVATLLSQVDAACFAAKEGGRDRVYVATGADDSTIRRHGEMQLVSKIAHALEHDLFKLQTEPVVDLQADNKIIYREVLLRLDGEDGTALSMGDIVPAAERYLLMSSIDRWVVRRTLGALANADDNSDVYALNLSGQTLGEEQSLSFILRQIEESGVDPNRLCFEITETAAVSHLSEAVRFMKTLSDRGVRFALDDFGSGLASFAYLKQLPVHFLKIDGSFVRGLPDNAFDRTMVSAIQRIGDEIGLCTVAEHAESEEIVEALKGLGIRYVQGYAIDGAELLVG